MLCRRRKRIEEIRKHAECFNRDHFCCFEMLYLNGFFFFFAVVRVLSSHISEIPQGMQKQIIITSHLIYLHSPRFMSVIHRMEIEIYQSHCAAEVVGSLDRTSD